MRAWRNMLTVLLLALPLLPASPARAASAAEVAAYSTDLADMLLILSGTATIFDSPRIAAALQDPEPLLASAGKTLDPQKVQALLKAAGFREWTDRPRLWIVEPVGAGSLTVLSADPRLVAEARYRALPLSADSAVAQDAATVKALAAKLDTAALQALLAEHKADALVVVQSTPSGYMWHLLDGKHPLNGNLPQDADLTGLLPHLLSEELAVPVQWPEAHGRTLVHVADLGSYRDFSGVQAVLRQLPAVLGLSLVRLDGTSAWFAVDAPEPGALENNLGKEDNLAVEAPVAALKPLTVQGRQVAAQIFSCGWTPPAADKPAAPAVQ